MPKANESKPDLFRISLDHNNLMPQTMGAYMEACG